jgi:tetratricopeptide (TPR) repeat protein
MTRWRKGLRQANRSSSRLGGVRLAASFLESPTALPALAAIALLIALATSQAGYPLTDWAPGALVALALLVIAVLAAPPRLAGLPVAVKLALACLAAYTALSFLSILWAGSPGDAWEGADRTLLYLLVFALFALWRGRENNAALLLSVWTLATIGLGIYVAIRLWSATGASFSGMFAGDRFVYPAGYPNASAAQWLIAFWPALLLARGVQLPWGLRGVLAGGAVVLADLALLSQSRGSMYATAVMLVLVFAFVPQRLRTFATAVPVALAIAATAPLVLRVGERIDAGASPHGALDAALGAMFVAALMAGLAVAAGAAIESRRVFSPALARGTRRVLAALAIATLLGVIVAGLVAAGDPIARARSAWHSFKGGYGTSSGGSRLLSGLGSNRYDFYRVSLDQFTAHPVLGIGADNFAQQYLAARHSDETPRYPHSVELRTLSQTGIVGVAIALVGLAAALTSAAIAMRRSEPLARTVAAAALGGFAYWAVHGSLDWFWEFAGLGASAFALLGIACSLQPRAPLAWSVRAARASAWRSIAVRAVAALLALAAVASLAAPWLSARLVQSAAAVWPQAPLAAYSRLDEAARLDPLSAQPRSVAGSIALRFGDYARAQHEFALALERVPDDAYATLELGSIESDLGRRTAALGLLTRAVRLNPRDPLARQALAEARSGRVDLQRLNREILAQAQRLS